MQRAGRVEQLAQRRRVGPRLGTQGGERGVLLEVGGGQELDPRRLPRSELAQAQLAPVGQAQEQARGAVARTGALVIQLQPPRRHEVDQQRQPACDVDDQMLAAPAHALDASVREL